MTPDERIKTIRDRRPPEFGGPNFGTELTNYYHARCEDVRFLLTELDRLKALNEWRDISTAPKDGTQIEVTMAGFNKFWYTVVCWSAAKGDWEDSDCYDLSWDPTHWRPLPDPPEVSE